MWNAQALLALDASLLERLTSNTGNLLEDEELIGVLANTKVIDNDSSFLFAPPRRAVHLGQTNH